jgi:cytochrome bd-type quinol oxidase subunit 2
VSVVAYGRIIKRREAIQPETLTTADKATGQDENKLITALAGVVPVEIIAAHGLVLAATTTTDKSGATTITSSVPLQGSLIGLVAVTVIVFLIARGTNFASWKPVDYVRLAIPPLAFVVWTALIGTSALSPWVKDLDHGWITVAAVVVGVVLVAVSAKVAPPKSS